MSGCEMIKCGFYKDGKCTDPVEYVDRETGDQVCRHRPEAIPKAEFVDISLREAARDMYEALKDLVGLLDSDDPVEVGCHCTDSGDALVVCAWCNAKAVLARAGG